MSDLKGYRPATCMDMVDELETFTIAEEKRLNFEAKVQKVRVESVAQTCVSLGVTMKDLTPGQRSFATAMERKTMGIKGGKQEKTSLKKFKISTEGR